MSVESKELNQRIQKYSAKEIQVIGDGISEISFKPDLKTNRENIF